jgi:hypothetical protein
MSTCSICLNPVRKTRNTHELPCGHLYHKKCINEWEERGNETCPLCRKNTNTNNFRVTLQIENLRNSNTSTVNVDIERVHTLLEHLGINLEDMDGFSSDIVFDAEDLEGLQSILADFGISTTDVNSSVLHTE